MSVEEEEAALEEAVTRDLRRLLVQQEARRRFAQFDAPAEPPPLERLDAFLATEYTDTAYRVGGLMPKDGDILLTAQYKAGKSTMSGNLIRSLVDGDAFLGLQQVDPLPEGRGVVLLDNELSPRTLHRWLTDQSIWRTDLVQLASLQGRLASFDILDDDVRTSWADRLRAVNAGVIIFDCLRPALDALGMSEDKEASRFAEALTALKVEAGADELVLVHHMGHGGQRSRGDSALQGWCTAEWKLLRDGSSDDPSGRRHFSAYGRDVDFPKTEVVFDPTTRRLTLDAVSTGDLKGSADVAAVLDIVKANPGIASKDLHQALAADHGITNRGRQAAAVRLATESLLIRQEKDSRDGRVMRHFVVTGTMWS
ncbi:AAA family ATPase [Rathayibacter sp. VKM Ac-2630]|uniref:AAA family ATPase n=1 Tax=Rathayibacter sp. VKM Ac-2630 TaxID=1938617 RepID=UPI000980E47E|nr:AAA family ATPase [Rathayibacter sp. VKM Ac-2630]OOB90491.1 hypothetical protein B0T42_11320 [Rathayibacter sp. VKM Ac-2630]